MKFSRKYLKHIIFFSLVFFTLYIWYFTSKVEGENEYLKVVFLDVGQGDAIYIEAPNGRQILIDGGPDMKLLGSLAEVMPFADRSIDMIIATHSDADHIGGFSYLLDNYKVETIVKNGSDSESKIYSSLEEKLKKEKIKEYIAHEDMHIILDEEENIYLDIIFPNQDIRGIDSNDGSIVGKLVYKDNSFMFTGDATLYTENKILWKEKEEVLRSDVLKLGHHGSKTSSGIIWLEKVNPDIAIISAGKNNKYGHPNVEVLNRLESLSIPFLSTYDIGNIILTSDGVNITY